MITAARLRELFSIVLEIDGAGMLLEASDTFCRHMPEYTPGVSLFDLLTVVRPATASDWSGLKEHMDSLFLLTARSGKFAIRGQLLAVADQAAPRFLFCGSPWLTWINDHVPNTKLGISDFSPQDSQLDQVFLITTEKRMVNDLERLNSALKKAKRETELAQEARAALFARMSHEMRTPLNGVISALSLLSDAEIEGEAHEILRLADGASQNLLEVINYVLDMSKIESSTASVESEKFDLQGFIESVVDVVRVSAQEKELDLRWEVDPALAQIYKGDKPKLRQCLINLASNAIKFTDEGKVVVRAIPAAEGNTVRFEIEDTGIGISEADRKRIFEPFWSSAEGGEKGTGLGLDIVRRAVEIMDGSVGVLSAPGAGSLFWVEVPLTVAEDEQRAEPAQDSDAPPPASGRFVGRVLLVDDNETNLILGRKIMEAMGATVEVARSGKEALTYCDADPYDLVFMDISMPGMDGVLTTIKLRERFDAKQLPVVALTAYASTEEEQRCLAAGMNHYLTKPIVREQLAEQMARFLDSGAAAAGSEATGSTDFNRETLDILLEQIGRDGVVAVVEQFRSEAPQRQARFAAAAVSDDAAAAQHEAHTLGSTCLSLGLDGAGQAYREAEALLSSEGAAALVNVAPDACGELLAKSLAELEKQLDTATA